MRAREIQGFFAEPYRIEVSPESISAVTDAVIPKAGSGQGRPPDAMCPVVFFDALSAKMASGVGERTESLRPALGGERFSPPTHSRRPRFSEPVI